MRPAMRLTPFYCLVVAGRRRLDLGVFGSRRAAADAVAAKLGSAFAAWRVEPVWVSRQRPEA